MDTKGYSPLSKEEQKAIEDMSLDELLQTVRLDLLAKPGEMKQPTPAEETKSAEKAAEEKKTEEKKAAAKKSVPSGKTDEKKSTEKHRGTAAPAPVPEMLRGSKPEPKKKKKGLPFGAGLAIYAFVFLLVIAGGLFFFWKYLEAFEVSRPDKVADAYMAGATESDWEALVTESPLFTNSDFESGSEIARTCFEAIRGANYSIRHRSGEYSDRVPVYTVRAGNTDLARLSLRQSGSAGFGFKLWAVDSVELLEDFVPDARSVEIHVPTGCTVWFNGFPLTENEITETIPCAELSDLEKSFTTELPSTSVYTVEGVRGNVTLQVKNADQEELSASYADGSVYLYEWTPTETYSVTVTAPGDAAIYVNGGLVSEEYVTEREETTLLKGEEAYLPDGKLPEMLTYTVEGLVVPVETVSAQNADGQELDGLQDGDSWSFSMENGEIPDALRERVAAFMEAYLRYSADVNDATGSNWSNVQQYLVTDGDAYERLYLAMDGLTWTSSYSVSMDDLQIRSYAAFGDSCCVVRVLMTASVTRADGTKTSDMSFDLVIVKPGETWLIEKMESV